MAHRINALPASISAAITLLSLPVAAQVTVIVHPGVQTRVATSQEIASLYLGKVDLLNDGSMLRPVDLAEGVRTREVFYRVVANREPHQVRAYWSKLVFTGKASPPLALASELDVRRYVAQTPNAIGYIDRALVDSTVRVLPLRD